MEPTTSTATANSASTTCPEYRPAIRLFLKGTPGPKGSRNVGKNGGTYEQSKVAVQWQQDATLQARSAKIAHRFSEPLPPPYAVALAFRFLAPAKPTYGWPVVGDLDKFERATLDALQKAGLLLDDKHVTVLSSTKEFVASDPGCDVFIESLPT